jgi:hypothetical protein
VNPEDRSRTAAHEADRIASDGGHFDGPVKIMPSCNGLAAARERLCPRRSHGTRLEGHTGRPNLSVSGVRLFEDLEDIGTNIPHEAVEGPPVGATRPRARIEPVLFAVGHRQDDAALELNPKQLVSLEPSQRSGLGGHDLHRRKRSQPRAHALVKLLRRASVRHLSIERLHPPTLVRCAAPTHPCRGRGQDSRRAGQNSVRFLAGTLRPPAVWRHATELSALAPEVSRGCARSERRCRARAGPRAPRRARLGAARGSRVARSRVR